MKKTLTICFVLFLINFSRGEIQKPKQDLGFFFGCPGIWNLKFFGSENLDENFDLFLRKQVGLGYSLNGGFIDTNHFGECLYWTRYYWQEILREMISGKEKFILDTAFKSRFHVEVDYLDELSVDEMREISTEFAGYLAFTFAVYHEMITFYGYKSSGIFCEKGSAFSPEDLYGDLLGTIVAMDALRADGDFDENCKTLIVEWMEKLGLQDSEFSKGAYEESSVGEFWNGRRFPRNRLLFVNLDIGNSGFLSPSLLSSFEGYPIPLKVPKIPENPSIKISVMLEPRESQGKRFQGSLGIKRPLIPEIDFPKIMEFIEKEAINQGLKIQK